MEFSPGLFTWPTISPRPTIIILVLAIRSLAKTTDVVNDRNVVSYIHSKRRSILLKTFPFPFRYYYRKDCNYFCFLSFFLFFQPTFSRKRERAKYPKVIAVNFTHAPPFLKFFPRPRAIHYFDDRFV